jgi:hypothetical protein
MKIWIIIAVPMAMLGSPVLAENWVTVARGINIDIDTIRRGSDGLVYFNDKVSGSVSAMADDCQRRIDYTVSVDLNLPSRYDFSDWRNKGNAVKSGSFGEQELNYVCANAR